MPTLRASEKIKEKIDAISEKTGWTQERILDWLLGDVDPSKIDFVIEGPIIVISRMAVRKRE